jgi:8-oxo-dGTP diphosphatase
MPASDQAVNQERYNLIPRTLIFLFRGESVLLLKGSPDKRIWANLYNGIGGHIERGEDPLTAATRELKEETGISPDRIWLAGTATIDTGEPTGVGLYVYKGISLEGQLKSSPEGDLIWISFDEISRLELVEDLPILLPKIRENTSNDPPFSAHYYYDQQGKLIIKFADSEV